MYISIQDQLACLLLQAAFLDALSLPDLPSLFCARGLFSTAHGLFAMCLYRASDGVFPEVRKHVLFISIYPELKCV